MGRVGDEFGIYLLARYLNPSAALFVCVYQHIDHIVIVVKGSLVRYKLDVVFYFLYDLILLAHVIR